MIRREQCGWEREEMKIWTKVMKVLFTTLKKGNHNEFIFTMLEFLYLKLHSISFYFAVNIRKESFVLHQTL